MSARLTENRAWPRAGAPGRFAGAMSDDPHHPPRRQRARVPRGRHGRRTWPRRSARAWPRLRSRRGWTATSGTSAGRSTTARTCRSSPPTPTPAATSCATRPRTSWPRRSPSSTPGPSSRSARPSTTASTTTSTCRTGRPSPTTTWPPSRPACGEIVAADQPFVRDELEPTAALELFADQPYKREIIERVQEADADDADAGEVARRHRHQRLPQHPGVRRPVPGPARPEHRAARPVQADEGGRRVLARRREGPDAPAHLRHGVGEPGRAGGAPPPPGGGREARPPPPGRRARPRLVPVRARRRAGRVAPQGRGDPQADGGLQPGPPRGRRLRVRVHPAPGQGRPLPDLRPPRLVQGRRCTRPWSWTTGPTTRSP